MARRPLAAALIVGAGALVLTGCLPMPPAIPQVQAPSPGSPIDPGVDPGASDPGVDPDIDDLEAIEDAEANTALGEQVTVDDTAGDAWSFAVTGVEESPAMESGDPEPGTRFVAVLIDGERVLGSYPFIDLFDIAAVGTDGVAYHWSDTVQVTAEDDIFYAEGDAFQGARAIIQLPEGVDADLVVLRSLYGHPQVEDTVVDVG